MSSDDKKPKKRASQTSQNSSSSSSVKVNNKSPSPPRRVESRQARSRKSSQTTSALGKDEMTKYVLWRRPVRTLYHATLQLVYLIVDYFLKMLNYRKLVITFLLVAGLVTVGFNVQGSHLAVLYLLRKKFIWYMWWCGLGIYI